MSRGYTFVFLCLFAFIGSANAFNNIIILSDNFNDGSITDWDTNAGTWIATSGYLDGAGLDSGGISHGVSMKAGNTYRVHYVQNPRATAVQGKFYWMTDQNGIFPGTPNNKVNGYSVVLSDGTGVLQRTTNGTPTTILNFGGGITVDTNHDVNILHTFDGNISVWIDGTYKGSVTDTTYQNGTKIFYAIENGGTNHNFDDLNILLTDTNATFHIVDEVYPMNGLPATMTINGSSWPVNSDGSFDINNLITFPATFVVSSSNYSNRTFYFDTNAGLYNNFIWGLRTTSTTKSVMFQFYGPDEATILSNRIIKLTRNNVLSGRLKTTSNGILDFNLGPQDATYDFNIMGAGSDSGSPQYEYPPITITINRPIDEKTNASIFKFWSVQLSGLGSQYTDNNSSTKTFTILGNTVKTYDFLVDDSNIFLDEYFPRNYSLNYKGDVSADTIQPYLVPFTNGTNVSFIVYDKFDNTTIPDLLVKSQRTISGSNILLENGVTNGTGLVTFSFQNYLNYNITVSDINQITTYFPNTGESNLFNNTFSLYNIFISITSSDINNIATDWNIFTQPNDDTLVKSTTQRFDANVYTNYADSITIEYYDGNSLIPGTGTVSSTEDLNYFTTIDTTALNTSFITLKITIHSSNRLDQYYQTYHIVETESSLGNSFTETNKNLGLWGGIIITLCFLFIALQQFGPNLFGNNESQVFLVGLILTGSGLLFFPGNFFPIIVALAVGVIIYFQVRT